MSETPVKGLKVTELVPGAPEKCPKCAGWGVIGEGKYPCPECRGQRTMRLAKVRGYMMVPIETALGDDFGV